MANEKLIYANALKAHIFWQAEKHNTDYLSVDMVVDAIDNAPTVDAVEVVQQWIPVTERLPERFVYVLAMTDFGEAAVARLKGSGRWYIGWTNDRYDDITHWMPLPQPPKEGE